MDRIVDIETDNRHLSASRGFLVVAENKTEIGRVALDEIAAVIVHAHGITYSNNLFAKLAEQGSFLVLCGANHAPVSVFWPLSGHYKQGARMQAQWAAKKPLHKQMWREIVVAKIKLQQAILEAVQIKAGAFDLLARKVKSGDPENVEAQAARRYWSLLMGAEFRRDRSEPGINGLLNYGYTVLRAVVSRSIVASGMHPTIGVHHHNRANDFALADDLMEPFRPIVDYVVYDLVQKGIEELDTTAKKALTRMTAFDLPNELGMSPLSVSIQRLCHSVATSFETGSSKLFLPQKPSLLDLQAMVSIRNG